MKRLAVLLPLLLAACLITIDESRIDDLGNDDAAADGERDSSGQVPTEDARYDAPDVFQEPDVGPRCDCPAKQVCRFGSCVLPTSCKELLQQHANTTTGVYDLGIDADTVPAYCDMATDGGGWTLVFKLNAGQPGHPYALFTGDEVNDTVLEHAQPLPSTGHYVSRLLKRWNERDKSFGVTRALVRLAGAGGSTILRELVFDAVGTSRVSFFDRGRLIASPWTDLSTAYYFDAMGHDTSPPAQDVHRNFFIHKKYVDGQGCPVDEGWLVILGNQAAPICPYEGVAADTTKIQMFYSPKATSQKWDPTPPKANVFTIFAR